MQRPKWTIEKIDNHDEGKGFVGFMLAAIR